MILIEPCVRDHFRRVRSEEKLVLHDKDDQPPIRRNGYY
jgi:hypothetical protein